MEGLRLHGNAGWGVLLEGGVASWENRHPRARVGSAIEAAVGLRPLGLLEMLQLES